MIASEIRFPLLMLIALMMVQSVAAAQEDYSQVDDETRSSQQQGMQENLEDAIRASDREQEQALIGGPNGALIGPNRVSLIGSDQRIALIRRTKPDIFGRE